MASANAMDSGVDTGNDSNDSFAQEKISKMELVLECSHQSKLSNPGKGTSTLDERQEDQHSSTSQMSLADSYPGMSLTHLQPASLIHGYEYQTPPPVRNFQFRPCVQFDLMSAKDVQNNFVTGSPFGTEYKGCDLVPKRQMRPALRLKCLRYASCHTSPANYAVIKDTLRMCRAVCHNNTDLMREMLASGKSPNCHDSYRRTPLHLAACMGYTDMVKLLLDHGADPNAKDSIGNTPLHLAACTNHVSVITLLLKAGTRVSEQDLEGHSPLQLAITKFNIMKRSIMPHPVLKEQVCQVITMLTEYMRRKDGSTIDPDLLNKFECMVRVSDSSEEVESNIRDLLSNLSSLSLSSTS